MKKTLVLVVDRDDDFGVKAKVNTPVIGVEPCLDAANAFGIADPEDSDLNALYSAVSTCLEIQEDGRDAEVALICGDEKVGHIADQALIQQLEEVIAQVQPDSIVLVGDGAEDEYIYPIISSRMHVDSVRKVFVKQAPGLEGTFYIFKKMISDPDKRRRFLVPLGALFVLLSLIFLLPNLILLILEGDLNEINGMSGPLAVMIIGLALMGYGYDMLDRLSSFNKKLRESVMNSSTRIIFLAIAVSIVILVAALSYIDITDRYMSSDLQKIFYFVSTMVWPVIIGVVIYEGGMTLDAFMRTKTMSMSLLFNCISLASLGLVATGILDFVLLNTGMPIGSNLAIAEIVAGIVLSFFGSYLKNRMGFSYRGGEDRGSARVGRGLREDPRRHGLLPRLGRGHRPRPEGRDHGQRPRGPGRPQGDVPRHRHRPGGRRIAGEGHRLHADRGRRAVRRIGGGARGRRRGRARHGRDRP